MKPSRSLLLLLIIMSIAAFFYFDAHHFLSLESLKSKQGEIIRYKDEHPALSALIYGSIYITVVGLSLPAATIMTLAGGALFGLIWGTLIVSFASSIGATLAFLAARFIFRDRVEELFGPRLAAVNSGIEKDGAFYLFAMRLVPLFPFIMINLAMGLTTIKASTFYWVSQLGMLAGTIVYVNAGTQLSKIESLSDILSPTLLASFALIGLFPLLSKALVNRIKKYKIYKHWRKPKKFDNNLVVIGAGSGGLVASYIAAAVKAKVTLIERHKMGGDCLNTGCVPSKALIRSSRFLAQIKQARKLGISRVEAEFDFLEIMERIQTVIQKIAPHDSIERYNDLGVEVITGNAKIVTPWEVQIKTGQKTLNLTTRAIVIAAGARPFVPPIPGLEEIEYFTSDNIWSLRKKPGRLLVLGGGPIGCELSQAFSRLGIQVTLVEMLPRIMIREDVEVSNEVMKKFQDEGINVLVDHTAKRFMMEKGEKILIAEHQGNEVGIAFDEVLLAIGRTANITGYGIEDLGIELSPRKTLEVNAFMETNYPNIFACGDVAGPYQFTHTAAHQAWYASINALFGSIRKFRADYSVIPWATFTEPEVARVGLNEQEAKVKGIPYEVSTYGIDDLDRAIADSEAHGFVKVLTPPGKDKVLGVTIVATHAGDLIPEFILAMKYGLGLNKLLGTIHIYPTMSEANKFAAGVWKRNHAPAKLLQWVERYHAWLRN